MIKSQTVKMISCNDLDYMVQEVYERPYCFQQQNGCKPRGIERVTIPTLGEDYENDTISEEANSMGVSFNAWLKRDPEKTTGYGSVGRCWERNFYPHLDMVLNDLHKRGLVAAGEYIINIDW